MMKKAVKLSFLVMAYLLFGARSCDNQERFTSGREQKNATQAFDSLGSAFSSDILSAATLDAFEQTALIRVSELLDYSVIASDTSVAVEFRLRASQMINEMFISEKCVLSFKGNGRTPSREITVNQIKEGKAVSTEILNLLKQDSAWILERLHPVSDTMYEGRIRFSLPGKELSSRQDKFFADGELEYYAVKRGKQFGTKTLKIWSVLLGTGTISETGITAKK